LTYDDGPTPWFTPAILAALGESGAHATFFVLMTKVREYPHLVSHLLKAGHEVALHGMDHRPLATVAPDRLRRDLETAKRELEDMTGQAVRWYRPPHGIQSAAHVTAVQAAGLSPALWNRTSWDWKRVSAATRVSVASLRPEAGVIVLMHDGHAGPADAARQTEVPEVDRYELTRSIIRAYARHGLTSCTLTELTAGGRPVKRPQLSFGRARVRSRGPDRETRAEGHAR
jgi:peptidoglycan/xylan/chitin deacetylase (PgdA/CDA1 family)